MDQYFWTPGTFTPIDLVDPDTGRSQCTDETLSQMRKHYPKVVITNLNTIREYQGRERAWRAKWGND